MDGRGVGGVGGDNWTTGALLEHCTDGSDAAGSDSGYRIDATVDATVDVSFSGGRLSNWASNLFSK